MNSRFLPFAVMALALAAGCQTKAPPRELVIQLTSALPVSFDGTIQVDGKAQPLKGTTPSEVSVRGNQVSFDVRQGLENGTLTIEVRSPELPTRMTMVTASMGPQTAATGSATFNY